MRTPLERIFVTETEDLRLVPGAVTAAADGQQMSVLDRTRLTTAVMELARNAIVHGGGGTVEVRELSANGTGRRGVNVIVEDHGAGIADVSEAMRDGFTTSPVGLGVGLGGARRLSDVFVVDSLPGHGTRIELIKWA